ncbi:MAG: site-specific integrase [Pseudomonadota bacterium]|nr:site-specific integrase [Pseudomonadota bacterium]
MFTKLPPISGAQQRGAVYHFNIPIPAQLRHSYDGKAAFRGTMKTADPKEAERKVRAQRTIFDQQLADKARNEDRARLAELLTEDQKAKLDSIGGADALKAHIAELRNIVAFMTGTIDDDGDEEIDEWERIHRRAQERSDAAFRDDMLAETRRVKRIAATLEEEVPDPPKGVDEGVVSFHDVAEKFMTARSYTVHNREKVLYTLRRWTELHGDIPIEKIERRHLNEFDEALKELPPALGEHRKLSFRKSVAKGKREGAVPISDKSRATYLMHMKSLTGFALDKLGVISTDPFVGYTTDKTKQKASDTKKAKRVPFSPAQVRQILDHAKTFDASTMDHWMPLLAAFTGARQEELAQLTVDDVVLIGNHWCIRITDMDPDQKVKNLHSLRTLPIPPALVDAGFLDYAQRRRQAGAKMLWQETFTDKRKKTRLQDVRSDRRGRFATNYGHRFRDKVRKPLGLTDDGMTFHSFRHTWADAARRAKLDPEIRRMIAGRLEDADPVEADYGGDDLLAEKLEALKAVAPFVAN